MTNFIRLRNTLKQLYFVYAIVLFYISLAFMSLHSQSSQFSLQNETISNSVPESVSSYKDTVNFLLPAVETFSLNILIWSFNRYARNVDWARISWETMVNNLKYGFVWDADGFETNQLGHPYTGALSFTAARSSGLNFWQSLPYPFAGSLMWEFFMEKEYPSMNDIITTPMSGIVLGETSFRISNLVLFSGEKNLFREVAAFILSPMNGFNRLVCGREMHSVRIHQKKPKYEVYFSAGSHGVFIDDISSKVLPHLYLNFRMIYGRYAKIRKNYKPFDYFETDVRLSLSATNYISSIFSSGMILGTNLSLSSDKRAVIGLFNSFDYLNTPIYKISAASVSAGIKTRHTLGNNFIWDNSFISSIIVMGGINSLYAIEVDRNYSLGPGTKNRFESTLNFKDKGNIYFRFKHYWIHPLSGAKGNEYVDIWMLGTSINFTSKHSIGIEFNEYDRWSKYRNYPNQTDNNIALRIFLTYHFGRI